MFWEPAADRLCLQGFPIAKIAEVVDYIIYMTYDFHGQWDYGNEFAV
jgi:GH18 family chitinase